MEKINVDYSGQKKKGNKKEGFAFIRFHLKLLLISLPGQELGFRDFTPPYLAPTTVGSVILQGVNYASGAGGILNQTGKLFVSVLLPLSGI